MTGTLLPLNTALNISHLTSEESAELQAVDLFSWGIFRKYENNDTEKNMALAHYPKEGMGLRL